MKLTQLCVEREESRIRVRKRKEKNISPQIIGTKIDTFMFEKASKIKATKN